MLLVYLCTVSFTDRSSPYLALLPQGWESSSTAALNSPNLTLLVPVPRCPNQSVCTGTGKAGQREVRQVVFAKVHKAASTTVQNILLRFAVARDLNVLLPLKGPIFSQTSPTIPRSNAVSHPEGKVKFDIFCSHVLYDQKEIARYFPESAVRVAIIREPLHQALSALVYYTTKFPSTELKAGLQKHSRDPINGYLLHPGDFCSEVNRSTVALSFVNNRMSIDLGFDLNDFKESKLKKAKIQTFLASLEKEFDLVLISDYFEESMILLRRYLNWSFKDIIYLKANTAKRCQNDSVWSSKPIMNITTNSTFHRWNIYDYELYNHFLPIFLEKIKTEHLFEKEVNAFKTIIKDVTGFCANATVQTPLRVPKGDWNEAFTVSKYDCKLMSTPEPVFIEQVRIKQQIRKRKIVLNRLKLARNIPRKRS